jgi:hypothetical protein
MSKLTSTIVTEVERLTRQVAELSAETGRFIHVQYNVDLLTHDELEQVAGELATDVLEVLTPHASDEYRQVQVTVSSPGVYELVVNLTSCDDNGLVYHRES